MKEFIRRVLKPIADSGFVVIAEQKDSAAINLNNSKVIKVPLSAVSQKPIGDKTECRFTVESVINSKWTAEIVDTLKANGIEVTECTLNKPEQHKGEHSTVKIDYVVTY